MNRQPCSSSIQVLSRIDTQHWHSPSSAEIRETRRSWILHRCMESARLKGFTRFVLYDANETYLLAGAVDPA